MSPFKGVTIPKEKESGNYTTEKLNKAVEHIDAIIQLLELGQGESGTEEFVFRLEIAVQKAVQVIVDSHSEGLCYDARWPLAEELLKVRGPIIHDKTNAPRGKLKKHLRGVATVITTNNAYDSILLVNHRDEVIGAWQAEPKTITAYLRTGSDAAHWEANWPGETRISEYGEECGRNGVILDNSRREFWNRIRHTGVTTQ
jgi:hypothetical protein